MYFFICSTSYLIKKITYTIITTYLVDEHIVYKVVISVITEKEGRMEWSIKKVKFLYITEIKLVLTQMKLL